MNIAEYNERRRQDKARAKIIEIIGPASPEIFEVKLVNWMLRQNADNIQRVDEVVAAALVVFPRHTSLLRRLRVAALRRPDICPYCSKRVAPYEKNRKSLEGVIRHEKCERDAMLSLVSPVPPSAANEQSRAANS